VLGAIGMNDLARDHLEMAFLLPVPAAYIVAVQPNHDGAGRLCRRLLRRLDEVLLHDLRADARRPVPHRARVLRPTHRQQLRQESRDLAERHQRRVPGCDIGELGCDGIATEVQDRKALRRTRALTRADVLPADAHRHVAE